MEGHPIGALVDLGDGTRYRIISQPPDKELPRGGSYVGWCVCVAVGSNWTREVVGKVGPYSSRSLVAKAIPVSFELEGLDEMPKGNVKDVSDYMKELGL